jgi:hypothetical protein
VVGGLGIEVGHRAPVEQEHLDRLAGLDAAGVDALGLQAVVAGAVVDHRDGVARRHREGGGVEPVVVDGDGGVDLELQGGAVLRAGRAVRVRVAAAGQRRHHPDQRSHHGEASHGGAS